MRTNFRDSVPLSMAASIGNTLKLDLNQRLLNNYACGDVGRENTNIIYVKPSWVYYKIIFIIKQEYNRNSE